MGALHVGHGALVEATSKGSDYVVVSIFVNPLSSPSEDLGIIRGFGGGCGFAPSAAPIDLCAAVRDVSA